MAAIRMKGSHQNPFLNIRYHLVKSFQNGRHQEEGITSEYLRKYSRPFSHEFVKWPPSGRRDHIRPLFVNILTILVTSFQNGRHQDEGITSESLVGTKLNTFFNF